MGGHFHGTMLNLYLLLSVLWMLKIDYMEGTVLYFPASRGVLNIDMSLVVRIIQDKVVFSLTADFLVISDTYVKTTDLNVPV